MHVVFLDGAYRERDGELVWRELPKLTTNDVAAALEATLRRIERHLRRHAMLPASDGLVDADQDDGADQEANLALSAVSGRAPPAGPSWQRGLPQLVGAPLSLDKHPARALKTPKAERRSCATSSDRRSPKTV